MIGGLLSGVNEFLVPTSVPEGAPYDAETLRMARATLLANLGATLLSAGQGGQSYDQRAQTLGRVGQGVEAYNNVLVGDTDRKAKQLGLQKGQQELAMGRLQMQQMQQQAAREQAWRDYLQQGLGPSATTQVAMQAAGLPVGQAAGSSPVSAPPAAPVAGGPASPPPSTPTATPVAATPPASAAAGGQSWWQQLNLSPEQARVILAQPNRDQIIQQLTVDRAKASFPMGDDKIMGAEAELRKEFTGNEAVKTFNEAQRNLTAMQSMTERAKEDGAGVNDIALVYAFFKTIDPASVVREAEFDTVAKNMGLPDRIVSSFTKLAGGGFLPQDVREELVRVAGSYVVQRYDDVERLKTQYGDIAKGRNLNPTNVTPDPRSPATRDMVAERRLLSQVTKQNVGNLTQEQLEAIPRPVLEKMTPAQRNMLRRRAMALQGDVFTSEPFPMDAPRADPSRPAATPPQEQPWYRRILQY